MWMLVCHLASSRADYLDHLGPAYYANLQTQNKKKNTSHRWKQTNTSMALSLSSSSGLLTISNSSSSSSPSLLTKRVNTKAHKPFVYTTPRLSFSRKLSQVQATILQENGEKVTVEDTFQPKSVPVIDEEKENNGAPLESSSTTTLERWAVKLEQSINIALTDSVIKILDIFYRDRDYARFFVLETIARVPYFAFMSVLHLYETFGWWRRADYLQVHFAESWNEMHHLLIMEELGGSALWFDRFLSQHIAVFYYFMTVFMYMLSPRMAYHFSECVEGHAFSTYDKFLKREGDKLKNLPAPEIAVRYYTQGDLYLFDEFQTDRPFQSRRPKIDNLYDVFMNIRDDEAEHCKTMKACQTHGNLRSPHAVNIINNDTGFVGDKTDSIGTVDCVKQSIAPQVQEEIQQSA